jgi:Polysaccharide pyruvyl transferase
VQVFASAMGQYDNVGDTVLRRGFLDTLRRVGTLNVFVGNRDADHVSALGLAEHDILYHTSAEWRARVSRALTKERSLYAFDTGETEVRRAFALRYLRLAPLLIASRLRGGISAHVGVGVRESTPWRVPISAVLRLCSVVTWRDEYSRRVMGHGGLSPDWAFALGSPAEFLRSDSTPRPRLAIAIRQGLSHAKREKPSEEWVSAVRQMSDELGLKPIVVAQIERDGPLTEELADRFGCEAVVWDGPNHSRQESRLRAVYRESSVVLSDRLHGLVIAATEGAVPIGLAMSENDKVTRTLAGVGISGTIVDRSLGDPDVAIDVMRDAIGRRAEIVESVLAARVSIQGLADRLVALSARN